MIKYILAGTATTAVAATVGFVVLKKDLACEYSPINLATIVNCEQFAAPTDATPDSESGIAAAEDKLEKPVKVAETVDPAPEKAAEEKQTEADAIAKPTAPTFDVVRVEPDGSTLVAGRGTPNSTIILKNGDKNIGEAVASASGEWVIIVEDPIQDATATLSLMSILQGGETVESDAVVNIAMRQESKPLDATAITQPVIEIKVDVNANKQAEAIIDQKIAALPGEVTGQETGDSVTSEAIVETIKQAEDAAEEATKLLAKVEKFKQEVEKTVEPVVEVEPVIEAEPVAEVEVEPVVEAEPEPVVEPEPEPVVEAEPEPIVEIEPVVEAEVEPVVEVELVAEVKVEPVVEVEAEPMVEVELVAEVEAEPVVEIKVEPVVQETISQTVEVAAVSAAKDAVKIIVQTTEPVVELLAQPVSEPTPVVKLAAPEQIIIIATKTPVVAKTPTNVETTETKVIQFTSETAEPEMQVTEPVVEVKIEAEAAPKIVVVVEAAPTVKPEIKVAVKTPPKAVVEKVAPKVVDNTPLVVITQKGKPAKILQGVGIGSKKNEMTFNSMDYSDKGEIIFSGDAAAGELVRVYVNNKFVGEAQADASGNWALNNGFIMNSGKNSMRFDQVNAAGQVISRRETKITMPKLAQKVAKIVPKTTAKTTAKTSETQPIAEVVEDVVPPKATGGRAIIIWGDNLWNISRKIYGKGELYTTIFKANKDQIRNPDLIYPGQVFILPPAEAVVDQ